MLSGGGNVIGIYEGKELACLYEKEESYLSLCEEDKKFFIRLFPLLLFAPTNNFSNKYLAWALRDTKEEGNLDDRPLSVSTVEKRMRRLTRAHLIIKWDEKNFENGKWRTTKRPVELDPATFAFVRAKNTEAKIKAARMEALEKQNVFISKETVERIQDKVEAISTELPAPEATPSDTLEEFKRMLNNL